jgi:hypothetical protein
VSTARDRQREQVADVADRYGRVLCWGLQRFASAVVKIMADSHQKGTAWQLEFAALAVARGLVVDGVTGRPDLLVAGLKVQCKHIDSVRAGRIDISNMRPVKGNDGLRGYLSHELDVLALKHLGELFLIPKASICNSRGVISKSVNTSFIPQFRDNWGVFCRDYVVPARERQQTFLVGG